MSLQTYFTAHVFLNYANVFVSVLYNHAIYQLPPLMERRRGWFRRQDALKEKEGSTALFSTSREGDNDNDDDDNVDDKNKDDESHDW